MAVNSTNKLFLTFFVFFLCLFQCVNAQASSDIPTVKDLRILKQQANSAGAPVVLLLTSEGCSYCKAIKENYLLPMSQSSQYKSKVLFRQLYIDEYTYLRNWQGELIAGDQIGLKYDVDVTPTILFVDAEGKEVAERIVGITSFDYFDKLLEMHILQAQNNSVQ